MKKIHYIKDKTIILKINFLKINILKVEKPLFQKKYNNCIKN